MQRLLLPSADRCCESVALISPTSSVSNMPHNLSFLYGNWSFPLLVLIVLNGCLPKSGRGRACPSFLLCQMSLLQGTIRGNNPWGGGGGRRLLWCTCRCLWVLTHTHRHTDTCVHMPALVHKEIYSCRVDPQVGFWCTVNNKFMLLAQNVTLSLPGWIKAAIVQESHLRYGALSRMKALQSFATA